MKLYCVIPFYNEAQYLPACLRSLAEQTDQDYHLVLVDNASTDESAKIAKKLIKDFGLSAIIVNEPQKGTGSAADTGFRYAIAQGATHIARIDADCLAAGDWIAQAKLEVADGSELVIGYPRFRRDEGYSLKDVILYPLAVLITDMYGQFVWSGRRYKSAFRSGGGANMVISARLYDEIGGFPRRAIEEINDDIVLFDAARQASSRVRRSHKMRTYASLRRTHKHGYLRTMLYYWDRKYQPKEVDVR